METLELRELSEYERERGKPMPTLNHSFLQKKLLVRLDMRYEKDYTILPELSLEMPQKPNAVPDICIFPRLEIDFLHDRTTVSQMPVTVIEITSPSQSNDEILAKFERYFHAGVQSCWLVLPSFKAISVYSQIGIYRFFTHTDTLTDSITGIELPLNEVFV